MNLASTSYDGWFVRLRGAAPRTLLILLLLFGYAEVTTSWAQHKPSEYEVKAAYLYNFGKFVKWPSNMPSQGNVFPVCILGNDPFGSVLDSLVNGESIDGKRLSARRINSPADAAKCRVLYINVADDARLSAILVGLRDSPVLTVGESPVFIDRGGIVQFVMQNERVRFVVNLGAAEKAGLVLSSELLKVAVSVKRDTGAGD